MAAKTPAERAIADVEKAIKDTDKAHEKFENLQSKADEALEAAKRTEKELRWRAAHPDLPDDFDLDEFRRSLEAPFEEIGDEIPPSEPKDALDDVDPVAPDEGELAAIAEGQADLAAGRVASIDAADEDDPWAGEA